MDKPQEGGEKGGADTQAKNVGRENADRKTILKRRKRNQKRKQGSRRKHDSQKTWSRTWNLTRKVITARKKKNDGAHTHG